VRSHDLVLLFILSTVEQAPTSDYGLPTDAVDAGEVVLGDAVTAERVATASELEIGRLVAGLVSASAGSGHGNCIAVAAAAAAPRATSDDEFGGGTPKAAADELGG
jgi:hypothetical protein